MATSVLMETLSSKTAVHLKNIQNSRRQFLFIYDNVYTDYRTVFYHLLHQWMKIWKSDHKLRQGHKLVRLP